jgi:hypothetical protein
MIVPGFASPGTAAAHSTATEVAIRPGYAATGLGCDRDPATSAPGSAAAQQAGLVLGAPW